MSLSPSGNQEKRGIVSMDSKGILVHFPIQNIKLNKLETRVIFTSELIINGYI